MTLGAEGRDQGHQGRDALLKYRGERSVDYIYLIDIMSFFFIKKINKNKTFFLERAVGEFR